MARTSVKKKKNITLINYDKDVELKFTVDSIELTGNYIVLKGVENPDNVDNRETWIQATLIQKVEIEH